MTAHVDAACPKDMIYGPCGGVTAVGGCELDDRPCPFADHAVLTPESAHAHRPRTVAIGHALIDLMLPDEPSVLDEIADLFDDVGATALVGEHVDDIDGLDPADRAARLADVGLPAIVTLTGRHRSPTEHHAEIERLIEHDVAAVHCVTGDHPAVRMGPDADATFSLDGTRLAAAVRAAGGRVCVGESPIAPPIDDRPARLASKQRAGADLAVLNHAGSPGALIAFADRATEAGVELELVAPVPVITDAPSARVLERFPGLVLPDGLVGRVLGADDPRRAGIEAAIELGQELLGSGRFAAVNLSGSATDHGPVERATMMRDIAAELTPA